MSKAKVDGLTDGQVVEVSLKILDLLSNFHKGVGQGLQLLNEQAEKDGTISQVDLAHFADFVLTGHELTSKACLQVAEDAKAKPVTTPTYLN